MTRPFARPLGYMLLLFVAVGCSKKEPPAAPEVEANEVEVSEAKLEPEAKVEPEAPAAPPAAPKVTLLSPGKPPHRALRWRFKKDAESELTMQMSSSMRATVDGQERGSNPTPPVMTVTAFKVDDVDESGLAGVSFTVRDAKPVAGDGFDPSTVAMIEQSMKAIVGVGGSYRVTDRAFVDRIEVEAPPNTPPAVTQTIETLRQTIRQVLAPLPEEPVGVGGKWAVDLEYEHSGMRVKQRSVFEVERLDADSADVVVVTEQSAPTQPITGANGQSATLQSLSSESKGTARWVFDELAPRSAKSDTKMNMTIAATGPDGTEHEMTMVMDMSMSVVAGAAAKERRPSK